MSTICSTALATFNGQNYGAGNLRRCRSATRWCLLLGGILSEAFALLLVVFGLPFAGIYTSDAGIALLNQKIGDALLESGRANVGVTEHNSVTCLKLTLLNPTVTLEDIKVLLSLVERTAQEVLAK